MSFSHIKGRLWSPVLWPGLSVRMWEVKNNMHSQSYALKLSSACSRQVSGTSKCYLIPLCLYRIHPQNWEEKKKEKKTTDQNPTTTKCLLIFLILVADGICVQNLCTVILYTNGQKQESYGEVDFFPSFAFILVSVFCLSLSKLVCTLYVTHFTYF